MTITAIAIPAGAIQVSALPIDYQWRGNWNQTTTYIINDKVFRGVSTWRAIAVNTADDPAGQTPSGKWVLVAQGLDPTVLNGAAAIATNAATQAATSATQAASSATLAAQQISGAAAYANQAAASATASAASTVQAQVAAGSATTSATLANAWAAQTSGTIDGAFFSSYYYAMASAGSASAAAGSATTAAGSATSAASSAAISAAWAMQTTGTVDGTYYSARYYAQMAATSAMSAAAGGAVPSGTFTVGHSLVAANSTGTLFTDSGIDPTTLATKTYSDASAKSSGTQIGDKLDTFRAPGTSWLTRNGSYYLSASYPVLAALLPGNGASTLTQSFTEAVGGFNSVAYSPALKIWVAVGDNATIYWSADRATWTQSTAPSATTGNYVGVVWHYALAAFCLISSSGYAAFSTNGTSWTAATARATTYTPTCLWISASSFNLAWVNGSTPGISYSSDAIGGTWNIVAPAPSFVVYGGLGRLQDGTLNASGSTVLVGASGNIVITPGLNTSGTTYTTRTSNTSQALYGVTQLAASGPGTLLYAFGAGGALVSSPDGVTWTARNAGLSNTLRAAAQAGQAIRVFGDGGSSASSPDLSTWTSVTVPSYSVRGAASDGTNVVLGANNTGASPTAGYLYNVGTTGDPAKGATQFQVPADQPASGTGYIRALAA